jgi:hypothetical protein
MNGFPKVFRGKPGLARLLNWKAHGPPVGSRGQKGRKTMFGSTVQRHLAALFGALLMSTVAVGAAVAPAQVSSPVSINA